MQQLKHIIFQDLLNEPRNWNFLDQLLLPYKYCGRDMLGMYFFIFASCEQFKVKVKSKWKLEALGRSAHPYFLGD